MLDSWIFFSPNSFGLTVGAALDEGGESLKFSSGSSLINWLEVRKRDGKNWFQLSSELSSVEPKTCSKFALNDASEVTSWPRRGSSSLVFNKKPFIRSPVLGGGRGWPKSSEASSSSKASDSVSAPLEKSKPRRSALASFPWADLESDGLLFFFDFGRLLLLAPFFDASRLCCCSNGLTDLSSSWNSLSKKNSLMTNK